MNSRPFRLDSGAAAWRHGLPVEKPMPLFLLRDGAIRRMAVLPEGLAFTTYTDRHQRLIHVVLDAESERLLLKAQPPRPLKTARPRQGSPSGDQPLAA